MPADFVQRPLLGPAPIATRQTGVGVRLGVDEGDVYGAGKARHGAGEQTADEAEKK
jgi:hypothetical protein